MKRIIVEARTHELDPGRNRILDLDKIVECHYKKATHVLMENGALYKVELGFYKHGGMPNACFIDITGYFSICDFPGDLHENY